MKQRSKAKDSVKLEAVRVTVHETHSGRL